jgi:hypothetical protein
MMNEYILFDAALCQRFLSFLAGHGLRGEFHPDQIEGFVVTSPDGVSDEVEQAIEDEYQALMAEQVGLLEAAGEGGRTLMRIGATLADGSTRIVQLPAIHGRLLFAHFSIEEIHDLVSAIAQSALNPVEGPICREP